MFLGKHLAFFGERKRLVQYTHTYDLQRSFGLGLNFYSLVGSGVASVILCIYIIKNRFTYWLF